VNSLRYGLDYDIEAAEMDSGTIPRRSFIEQFFTFLIPIAQGGDRMPRLQWKPDITLKKNIESCQEKSAQFRDWCQTGDDRAIVQDFLQLYQQDSTPETQRELAKWHIAAYLEAPLYRAAHDRLKAFRDYESPAVTWEHYLHLAKRLAYDPVQIFPIYQRYQPEKYRLEQHFQLEIASKIRDLFYQETGKGKYSIWFALKRASKSELHRGLTSIGVQSARIACYIAVRDALFEVYSKSGNRWLEPTSAQYQVATAYLNRHYAQTECISVSSGSSISISNFQTLVKTCIQAIQTAPTIESLESYQENFSKQSLDATEELALDNPIALLQEQQSQQEWKQRTQTINARLAEQIQQFDEIDQAILKYRSLGSNQTQIANQVGINQATVSRRYQRCQRQLLKAIATQIQAEFNHSLTLENLESLENYITIWLQKHYQTTAHAAEES
jgi:DNA-directed RNA polymerase specialized sigma24 family protein